MKKKQPAKTVEDFENLNAARWRSAMLRGDFEAAWLESDRALNANIDYRQRPLHLRAVWQGAPVDGRHLLIRCWRGLGDTIQFIRYIPLLVPRVASIIVEADELLFPILETLAESLQLVPLGKAFPDQDAIEIECTELPFVFRTTLSTIPARVPYLNIETPQIDLKQKALKVGICWRGGDWVLARAIPLVSFRPLQTCKAVFFQLQRGPGRLEMATAHFPFFNPDDNSPSMLNTAQLIQALDLVISIDTMIAHLAGALGKPVWTLLHDQPDWRWMDDRDDSPWYPTMRLFRQKTPGDWDDVIENVRAGLAGW
ncbi:MAG: ADP-heptose--LPS heptosyltransferase [Verrucomicrobia bacterium]|nr:ADP-heptose--LPS heptosyltransferase [Verrucomicrobiota bacterium]